MFKEYFDELNENLCFQSFDKELHDPLSKYGEPGGSLFLACWNSKPAGCIALQPLQEEGTCEMKRLFVKPGFRDYGIGAKLVQVIIDEARQKGYRKMVLDTLERLQPAIKLYRKYGFKNTAPYYKNPLLGVVYMQIEFNG